MFLSLVMVSSNVWTKNKFKSKLSLYLLYYAEACNKLAGPISVSLLRAVQLLSKKRHSGGEPLATQCLVER